MPSRVLETILSGKNLLSPVLTTAAADVERYDAKVTASQEKAATSAETSAKAQTGAAERVQAANARTAKSSSESSAKVVSSNARAAESSRAFADVSESSAARAGVAWASLASKALPLVGAALVVVTGKMAGDYQQLVTKLETTAGESQKNLGMVGQGMLDMAGQVGISATELARGMYTVESAGYHGAAALTVLKASAQGARQENADLGKVTDAVSTILHDYHLPASQAATVTSQLVTAVSHGKTTFDELTGSLHSVTPLASVLGVTIADVTGTLSAMTASGESADQATQNMADTLRHLASPTSTMTTELAQLGITSSNLADDLSHKGLAGTLQLVEQAIVQHMDPATKRVLLPALNASKTAAQDLKIMMGSMPPELAKASQSLLTGSTSITDYQKAAKSMGGTQGAMALQFLSLYKNSDGFNQVLKQGGPAAQAFTAAMAKSFGTASALNVALMTTGENAAATNASIKDIGKATADTSGNIKGWSEVQGNFNQKLAQASAEAKTLAIEAGQHLLPVLTGIVGWVGSTGLPAIGHLGSGIGDLVHDFQQLPGPVKTVAEVLAGLALANAVGVFSRIGTAIAQVRFITGVYAASTSASMATVSAAYQEAAASAAFLAEVQGRTAASGLVSSIAGLGAAAKATAVGGLSMLRAGASGLIGILGGPWVVGIAAAAGLLYLFNKQAQDHDKAVKTATEDVTKWYKAMSSVGGQAAVDGMNHIRSSQLDLAKSQEELNRLTKESGVDRGRAAGQTTELNTKTTTLAQHIADLTKEMKDGKQANDDWWNSLTTQGKLDATVAADEETLAYAIQTTGTNSIATKNATADYNAAKQKQKDLTDKLTTAEQTEIEKLQQLADIQLGAVSSALAATQAQSQLADGVAQYNKDAKDGQHSTKQLKDESNNLASQAISTALAIGKQEHDQLKANGQTDDGTVANKLMLDSLRESAKHITGPGHDALVKAYNDLLRATAATTTMKDTATQMGLNVVKTFDNNTVVIKGATDAQIADLKRLGDKVTHLPNGNIVVTSDTHMARATLDALINDYNNKVIRIMTPGGQHISSATGPGGTSTKADGGPIIGPGTGTSDTAGLYALSNGEHIWTAAETTAAGGHAGVERLRRAVLAHGRGRANGGAVFNMYDTIPADLSSQAVAQAHAAIAQLAAQAAASFSGGGAGSPAIRELGRQIAMQSGYGSQFSAIDYIFSHESGWNPTAQNPTSSAYGIPQFLSSTWAAYGGRTSDAGMQIRDGIAYMRDRYGSPDAAASFWAAHHWYRNGTNYVPSDQLAVLHRGEAVVPAAANQGRPFTPTGAPGYSAATVGRMAVSVAAPQVTVQARVFIGDREITDIVRIEATTVVDQQFGQLADTIHYAGN